FTALSNTLDTARVLSILNTFFETADAEVTRRGGEILKFLGDGLLAVFPFAERSEPDAARAARDAVRATRSALTEEGPGFRSALHAGEVVYGNIGAPGRLDFTVIGPAVNLTARLLSAAESIGAEDVCSARVATHLDAEPAGQVHAKGFETTLEIFRVGPSG
ncbi:MAG: adenylate/guanylate cyclase domain-containing protein, partial [Pseudomonadota bacterium]